MPKWIFEKTRGDQQGVCLPSHPYQVKPDMRTGVELPGKVGMNNLETNYWEKNGLGIKWNG